MTQLSRGDRIIDPTNPTATAVVVEGPISVGGRYFYVILTASQEELTMPEDELRKKETNHSSPASWLVERPLVDQVSLSCAATFLKMTSSLTDMIYSFSAARTLFRPHQFKPVLKLIESSTHRLLLADEVGLGKTIEAGLIWTELDARASLRRVLVVCPSGLVAKWQLEMDRRFDRELRPMTSADLVDFATLYADRGDSARLSGVISYAQLRNQRVIDTLSNQPPTFDLVIFDEAHALRNPSTRTHHAAQLVTDNSDAVVFLSATPVNLGSDDLFQLMHLLRPDEFTRKELFASQIEPNSHVNLALRRLTNNFPPDNAGVLQALRGVETTQQRGLYQRNPIYQRTCAVLAADGDLSRESVVEIQNDLSRLNTLSSVYTRTRKRDLRDHTTVRRATHLQVVLTEHEKALYESTLGLVGELRGSASGFAPALAAVMPARQASSCLPAMRKYVDTLQARGKVEVDVAEGEEDDDDSPGLVLELEHSARLERLMDDLSSRSDSLGSVDTKFEALTRALDGFYARPGPTQVLLFSFFRLTLDYLDSQLSALGYRCAQMHGGTLIRERTQLVQRFRDGELDILLCSEVGSEGLDFEFCDVLVNYDLPWNPMRVEQRIGRLDRFGQQHPIVHIINFEIDGTIDSDIFLRLYRRIGVFEQSIGELEPILGATVREVTRGLITVGLTSAEQQQLADRTALAVEAQRHDVERFNEAQDQLVSADAFVEDALQSARDSRRYLTPFELERYAAGFLREAAHPAKLTQSGRDDGVLLLQGSPLLADRLRELSQAFLTPAFSEVITRLESGSLAVTFDAERAYGSEATFLSHRHPLLRAVTEYYRPESRRIHPGGYVRIPAVESADVGQWIFYVFALSATGLMPQRTLFAVASRLEDPSRVEPAVGDQILSWLAGPDVTAMKESDIPFLDPEAAVRCYEAMLQFVAVERDDAKARLVERNEALIGQRQDSLSRELEVRKSRLAEMANRPGLNDRIRRMRTGQITNLETEMNSRIAHLDKNREVAVGFNVVLGGLADLTRLAVVSEKGTPIT